ncbi:uncharacterized protein [Oryctolagus cuniculus]|uniref:uncharacterized protein n=1 Tax=Oryctolagus cuniculus TaxID=9986 RepID=UPI00048F0EA6
MPNTRLHLWSWSSGRDRSRKTSLLNGLRRYPKQKRQQSGSRVPGSRTGLRRREEATAEEKLTMAFPKPPTLPHACHLSSPAQGPAASPHSPSVRRPLGPTAGAPVSMELRQRFKPTRSAAHLFEYAGAPAAGHAGNCSSLSPSEPSARGETQAGIQRHAANVLPRDPDDDSLHCARERGTPGYVVSAHSPAGGPVESLVSGERAAFYFVNGHKKKREKFRTQTFLSLKEKRSTISSSLMAT